MKLKPIVNQLAKFLPFNSDKFTDISVITSLSATGGVATVVTATVHNLSVGSNIVVTDTITLVTIDSLSLDADTNQVTARTSVDNGLSLGMNFKTRKTTPLTVEISGVAESEYNGTFELIAVPNRNAFVYQLPADPAGPPIGTGTLAKFTLSQFNGLQIVDSVLSTTSFTYNITSTDTLITTNVGNVHSGWRISRVIDLERAIDSYTKKNTNEYWLFVTPNTSVASKNREILNDSITTYRRNHNTFRQRLIESLNMFIFVPTSDEISAGNAIDELEDIKVALFKTILRFPTAQQYDADDDTDNQFVFTYNSSEVATYETAFLAFQFIFDTNYDITYHDTFNANIYAPFRNIDSTQVINEQDFDYNADLDVDPDF